MKDVYDPLYNHDTAAITDILIKHVLCGEKKVLLMDVARELKDIDYKKIHYRVTILETFGYVRTTRYKKRLNCIGKKQSQVMIHPHPYALTRLYTYLLPLLP